MADPYPDVRALFCEALDRKTPEERAEYLEQACLGKPELRQRVEALLRAHDEASGFLQDPSSKQVVTVDEPPSERPGTTIGSYILLEQIGEGGFGVVYMAEQTHPVRRKVALKVLKPGMDTRQVVARFEAERQALAIMDHPNIARVFDGGASAVLKSRSSASTKLRLPTHPPTNSGPPSLTHGTSLRWPITIWGTSRKLDNGWRRRSTRVIRQSGRSRLLQVAAQCRGTAA